MGTEKTAIVVVGGDPVDGTESTGGRGGDR
jgi:hypothetical protein